MNKKTIIRIVLLLLIGLLTAAAVLIAIKLNSSNPLDSSIGNTKTRATFQKQIEIPNVTIPPTEAPSPTPTQTLLAVAPTTELSPTDAVVVVAQTTPTPTTSTSEASTITVSPSVATTDALPAAGSFQSLLVLALAASTVIVVSLLF